MSVNSIGIDVSKNTLDVCLLSARQSTSLQVNNNQKDVPILVKQLACSQIKEDTPIVIEATGGYHHRITFTLRDKGFQKVHVINPLLTRKYLRGAIRKTKTDKIDAQILAEIGLKEKLQNYTEKPQEILNKKKVRLYHFLKKQLQQINTKITLAKDTLADSQLEIKILLSVKNHLQKQIAKISQAILETATSAPVSTIYGVSDLHYQAICLELGDLEKFSNHKQVIAFAGLDPSVKESGSSVRGRSHLSKRGSKTLRYFLFQSAWGVMMHNPEFKEYYQKKRAEGKHYFTCLAAVSRKLLCKIYQTQKAMIDK